MGTPEGKSAIIVTAQPHGTPQTPRASELELFWSNYAPHVIFRDLNRYLVVGGIAIFGMSIKNISEVISNDKKA
jgi:hypothetical protein